ncbi:MAG: hypothetical protein P4M11_11135 [Candidatus Pacebacteria bacterium]|nr:hypothetical protein [Candidatus Paceibacterota bacterium]
MMAEHMEGESEANSARGSSTYGELILRFGAQLRKTLFGTIHSLLRSKSISLWQYFFIRLICCMQFLRYPFFSTVTSAITGDSSTVSGRTRRFTRPSSSSAESSWSTRSSRPPPGPSI